MLGKIGTFSDSDEKKLIGTDGKTCKLENNHFFKVEFYHV